MNRYSLLFFCMLLASEVNAVGLPDSGQDQCDNGSNVMATCAAANTSDTAAFKRQDGRFGYDAKGVAGTLAKTGGGMAGFDYTKIDNSGNDASAGATLGAGASDWACTRDNVTGLTWEVKTDDNGLRDKDWTYAWYSNESTTNGGNSGSTGGATCEAGNSLCNTEAFLTAVNSAALCSYTDWRLPSLRELSMLVNYGAQSPSIDLTYFQYSTSTDFWSSSSYVVTPASAWSVLFIGGFSNYGSKANVHSARLVRGVQF